MPELTEDDAEKHIRRRLKEKKWSPDDIDKIIDSLTYLDGFWSYGTTRVIKDLEQIYVEMIQDGIPEKRAESYIRRGLREQDWSISVAEVAVDAVSGLDGGFMSDGTFRAISHLEKIYGEMVKKYGEPPDRDW